MISTLFLDPFNLIIILGISLIIIEIILGAATGFELFVIGLIVIASGGVGKFTESYNAVAVTIIVLTALYIFIGRKYIRQSLHITTHKTNTESIIGKKGIALSDITEDDPGQIKVEGEVWRAQSETPIKKGERVTVESVSGVTAKVTIFS